MGNLPGLFGSALRRVVPLLLLAGCNAPPPDVETPIPRPAWLQLDTGSGASLRGISALDADTAWVTGSGGAVLRTLDGGETWQRLPVEGAEELDFRDVEAFDADTAVLMTAGQPARLYHTADGGRTFTLAHESPHPEAFFDGVAFWDRDRGLAFSDPVDGQFLIVRTEDGGRSWQPVPTDGFPVPLAGEAGFAASGSSLQLADGGRAWIGLGGAAARVLRSADYGQTWEVSNSPIYQGQPSAGIFSLAVQDDLLVAAGGDYQQPERSEETLARSEDGGVTWALAATPPPSGHRAAVVFVEPGPPTQPGMTVLSVGRSGCDLSRDAGNTWERFADDGFYTLSRGNDGSVWTAGSDGRTARLYWVHSNAGSLP